MNPLHGQTLILLRSPEDIAQTAAAVQERGAVPLACPVISMRLPGDPAPLDNAIKQLETYDWLFFTSGTSVRFFHQRFVKMNRDTLPPDLKIAAIGKATLTKLLELGWPVHFTPNAATAEEFLDEFAGQRKIAGERFLLPLSHIARKTLPDGLRQYGAKVTQVTAYINEAVTSLPIDILETIAQGRADWVLFTSSSTARNFYDALPGEYKNKGLFKTASIGPKTTETLKSLNITPDAEAEVHNIEGLLDAIEKASA